MLRKYFCIKNLCRQVIDNLNRDLQASNFSKECKLNWTEPREVKDNSYELSINHRSQHEANLPSFPGAVQAQRQILVKYTTPKEVL